MAETPPEVFGEEAEERGLREILRRAPVILFALDAEGRLRLAEGGLLEKEDLPRPEVGTSLLEYFAGSEIGDAVARVLRGERFQHDVDLGVGIFEVHYFPWERPDGRPGAVGLVVDATAQARAVEALRESDERLRIISDHAREMISEQGPDSEFVFASRSYGESLGYAPEELLGRRAADFLHPEDRREVIPGVVEALARGEPVRWRSRLRRRDGSYLWGDSVSRAFLTEDGARHVVTVTRDVTREREREQRRARQVELLEHLSTLNSELVACPGEALEACMQHSLGAAGRLADSDRAVLVLSAEAGRVDALWWTADPEAEPSQPDLERLAELARSERVEGGEPIHVPDLAALPPASPWDFLRQRGGRALLALPLRTGVRSRGFVAFGRTREARGWEEEEIEVLRLLADSLARGFARLEAERALLARRRLQTEVTTLSRRLLSLRDRALDDEIVRGLALVARIAGVENAVIAAADPQERRLLALHQHLDRWDAPRVQAGALRRVPWLVEAAFRTETVAFPDRASFSAEAQASIPESTRALLVVPIAVTPRFHAYLCAWSPHEVAGWGEPELARFRVVGELLAAALDRRHTEQAVRESEEQLTQSQKMETVGRLAGNIAHDFNNLLTVIAGNAEVMVQELPQPRAREDALEIRRAADLAAQLTRDLLAFSRSRAGALEVVSLNDVVREVTALLERTLGDDIEVDLRLRPEVGHVEVEPDRLRQIVVNLALNAREAMPEGGRLSLETRIVRLSARQAVRLGVQRPGRHAVLEVRDEGEGMDAEIRERVFEPFFTTRRSGTSVGLGLSIAYSTLKEMGGAVAIESRRDRGTCVRLFLPLPRAPGEAGGQA